MKLQIPKTITSVESGWCPGCGHGIVARILTEVAEEMGVSDKVIMVRDVACGAMISNVVTFDNVGGAHGRPIITACGVKRVRKDALVIAHPGDGSAYSIGMESTIHAALRNENILALVVNNCVFGMTGGQMAPTTLPHQVTATTANGRDPEVSGMPIKLSEMLSVFPVAYIARGSVHRAGEILKTKAYIKKALQAQIDGKGFSMIEILSPCPTNWHMSPAAAADRIDAEVIPYYPLGELVKKEGE